MARQTLLALLVLSWVDASFAIAITPPGGIDDVRTSYSVSQNAEEREPGPADLEEAIEIALARYGGRAADAETVVRDGRTVHEITVLGDDGSVRTVRIEPETGAIIPQGR